MLGGLCFRGAWQVLVVLKEGGHEEVAQGVVQLWDKAHSLPQQKKAAAAGALALTAEAEQFIFQCAEDAQLVVSELLTPLCIQALVSSIKHTESLQALSSTFMRSRLFDALALQKKTSNAVLRYCYIVYK